AGFAHFAKQSYANTKRRPKKGEPKSGPLRGSLRCSRHGGNSQTCPLRGLRTCEFLIPTPLRCSARPHGRERDRERTTPPARSVLVQRYRRAGFAGRLVSPP